MLIRLAQPGVEFFEVDLPVASERKQKLAAKLRMTTPEVRLVTHGNIEVVGEPRYIHQ